MKSYAATIDVADYQIVVKDKKKGLIDERGKVIIPIKYEDLGWSNSEDQPLQEVIGYSQDGLWGLISLKNKKVTPPEYSILERTASNFIIAARKGSFSKVDFYGVMNVDGKNVIPYQYHKITFSKSRFIATYKDKTNFFQGLLSADNRILIPFKYKQIEGLNSDLFMVQNGVDQIAIFNREGSMKYGFHLDNVAMAGDHVSVLQNGRRGLLDPSGDLIADPQYHSISISNDRVEGLSFSRWVVLSADNEVQLEFKADRLIPVDSLYLVHNGGYQWLINDEGDQLTNPYQKIIRASDGISVVKKEDKFGLMKSSGMTILPAIYDSIYYADGFAYCKKLTNGNSKWSLFDTLGVKKTHFQYQEIRPFSDRLFAVKRRGKWGFITRSGQEVIYCVYESATDFHENKAVVQFHKETGIINRDGDWVVLPRKGEIKIVSKSIYKFKDSRQSQLRTFDGELIYFTNNNLKRVNNYFEEKIGDSILWNVNFRGTVMDSTQIIATPDFKDGEISIVMRDGKWGALNMDGSQIISFQNPYQELHHPSEGFFGIKLGRGFGFVDYKNQLRIANRYEGISKFKEGLAAVKLIGKWGFIDKSERIIIQPSFESVLDFQNGLAIVSRNSAFGLIGKQGQKVQPVAYSKITRLDNGKFLVVKNGKMGLLAADGRELILPRYDELRYSGGRSAIVRKSGKYGLVDLDGVSIIPQRYDEMFYNPNSNTYVAKINPEWVKLQ